MSDKVDRRISILFYAISAAFLVIVCRLFYWQLIFSNKTKELAFSQYNSLKELVPTRGEILTNDGFPLVSTQKNYLLYAVPKKFKLPVSSVIEKLLPVLSKSNEEKPSSESAIKKRERIEKETLNELNTAFKNSNLNWIPVKHRLTKEQRNEIEKENISGLEFSEEMVRFYPEASMAAQLIGFLGKDDVGQDKGYFGAEGFYDLELKGRPGLIYQEKDAVRNPILIGSFINQEKKDGKNLVLYLDRSIQLIIENKLAEAISKYGAKSGSVTVMDPYTGGILAMASHPSYDPRIYFDFDKTLYRNSVIDNPYEPGSTFKIFVMSAAINQGVIKPETICDICDKSYKIDKYQIKTWNDKYYPNSSMTEVLIHSDNVGMVFVSQKLKLNAFLDYLQKFGFNEKTNIDLQGEISLPLKPKNKWNNVDLSTASFGQGIAVTTIQVIRAGAAIANGGNLVEPHVVKQVVSGGKIIDIKPKTIRKVISENTSRTVISMMVDAVERGETRWLRIPGYKIAGKTGTAQIPIAGHYDQEKTIASFIGFAPASKPKFIMLVTLQEPSSSPWGSETAAPLFFSIAKEIINYYGIQPE